MTLLSSFKAVHYRGIDGLSLPRLTRANLVTGVNGIGKSALLEAIWLFTGRYNPALLWNAYVQRSTTPVLDPIATLSTDILELHGVEKGSRCQMKHVFEKIADIARPANIGDTPEQNLAQLPVAGRIHTYIDRKLAKGKIGGAQPTPWGLVAFQNPASSVTRPHCLIEGTMFQQETSGEYLQRYSDIVRDNRKEELTSAINLMLPKVKGVEILTDQMGTSYLSARTTDGMQLPLHNLGGGVVRLTRLLLNFFTSRNGLLLTDEIENGIHYSVLFDVWSFSRKWMYEWNVQLVATTHSDECIGAAMETFSDIPEDLSIHKLFLNEETGKVDAVTFSGDSLKGARDLNMEVR